MTQEITNTVQRFFASVDAHDWASSLALMAEPFYLDYSSFGAGPGAELAPADIIAGWQGLLPGFDATQHLLGPLHIEAEGHAAQVRAQVSASHFIEGAEGGSVWLVNGSYEIAVIRTDGGWKLSGLTFLFAFQSGNLGLPAQAQSRAAAQAAD